MATRSGLDFGTEILATYGPLGFLAVPTPYYTSTFVLSAGAILAAHFGAVAVVAHALSRAFGLLATAVLTYLFASIAISAVDPPELLGALVVAVCATRALGSAGEVGLLTAGSLAVLAALILLVKLSAGILALCVLGVAVSMPLLRTRGRGRRALVAGLVFIAYVTALVGLWLLSGQPIGNLGTFLAGSADLVTGYGDAMASEEGRRWDYLAALLAAALLAVFVMRATKGRDRATRLVVGAVFAGFLLGAFRAGFTRHDTGHSIVFFSAVAVAMTGLAMREHRRIFLFAAIPLLVSALALQGVPEAALLDLERGPKAAVGTARVLASEEGREAVQRQGRRDLRAASQLSGDALALMRGRTVHVDPWDAQVVWAYPELRWRPAPVFQTYFSYTSYLDNLNADFLASSAAPAFILTQPQAIDGRVGQWESPNYVKEVFCRYRQVLASPPWAILSRDRNRCDRPVELARRRVGFGQTVPVPQGPTTNDMVLARVEDIEEPLAQSVRALLLRPEFLYAKLGRGRDARFLRGHAGGLHVMRLPECLGEDRSAFDTRPVPSLSLHTDPRPGQSPSPQPGSYSIAFFTVRVDC